MPPVPPSSLRRHGPWILRTLAVLISAMLSTYGLLWGYASLAALVMRLFGIGDPAPAWMYAVSAMMGYAWIAWWVLAVAWIRQRRLHRWWPISGSAAGIGSVLWTFGFAIPFTFPAIIMAIVFVTFALSKEARQMEEARRPGLDRVN
jgi:hypothetical protein